MKKMLIILAVCATLVLAPWWGARQAIAAMEQQRQPGELPLNMAYWATLLPGMARLVDVPRTQLAFNWHQLRAGTEFADAAELQQRAQRFIGRMQHWLTLPALRPDGILDAQAFGAQAQTLALLARLPWAPADSTLVAQLQPQLATALQAPAASTLPALQRFEAAQTLALLAARQHDNAALQRWQDWAYQILPQPTDIKAQTAENTARHLLPLRTTLAGCTPGHAPPGVPQAQAALAKGYDVQQLRQQYVSGWDRALLLWAQQPGNAAECATIAGQYKTLLTAAQP